MLLQVVVGSLGLGGVGGGGGEPAVHGDALDLVRALPVERLARAGAVVGGAAHGAAPELVPPRLLSPAPQVGAQPELALGARGLVGAGALLRGRLHAAGRPPVGHEEVRRVRLRLREAPPEVGQERAPGPCAGARVGAGDEGERGEGAVVGAGEGEGELARVGSDEEAAALGRVAAHPVAILEAVPELAERVDVSQRRGARAQGRPGAEVAVRLGAAAAVELDDRQRVERRRVPAHRRLRQHRRAAAAAAQAVEPDLHADTRQPHACRSTQVEGD